MSGRLSRYLCRCHLGSTISQHGDRESSRCLPTCLSLPHLNNTAVIVAIFYPFSQFCEIDTSLLSLQKQPNTAPNLFQRGVEYGKSGCPKDEPRCLEKLYILQRGVQWKQGVVVYILLQAVLLCNTTPIHCTPLPLHPTLQSIQ